MLAGMRLVCDIELQHVLVLPACQPRQEFQSTVFACIHASAAMLRARRQCCPCQACLACTSWDALFAEYTNDTINRFALQVILQDDSGKQLCTMYSDDTTLNKNNNNLQQILVPFQNYPSNNQNPPLDCRNALKNATMIGFQALFDGVTFCVDDVALEPSMVVTAGSPRAEQEASSQHHLHCSVKALAFLLDVLEMARILLLLHATLCAADV